MSPNQGCSRRRRRLRHLWHPLREFSGRRYWWEVRMSHLVHPFVHLVQFWNLWARLHPRHHRSQCRRRYLAYPSLNECLFVCAPCDGPANETCSHRFLRLLAYTCVQSRRRDSA